MRVVETLLAVSLLASAVFADACTSEVSTTFSTMLNSTPKRRDMQLSVSDVSDLTVRWSDRSKTRGRNASPAESFTIASEHSNTTYVTRAASGNIVEGYGVIVGTSVGMDADDVAVIIADYETGVVYVSSRSDGMVQSGFFSRESSHVPATSPYSLSIFPAEEHPLNDTSLSATRMRRNACAPTRTADGRTVLRVGVLHSAEAAGLPAYAPMGGSSAVQMEVAAAVAEANAVIFPNSGVAIEIQLCVNGPMSPDASIEKASPSSTLSAFASSESVAAVRDAGGCDVMVLFSTLAGLGNRACGIGYMFPGAHAVVAAPCFKDNYSFIHEILHTFGSCHGEPAMPCGAGANGYGDRAHGFRTIEAYRGACGYTAVNCTRIPRISNSHTQFTWSGWPIGNARHSNAWIVNANSAYAATRRC